MNPSVQTYYRRTRRSSRPLCSGSRL
jgi:hypothetical protein